MNISQARNLQIFTLSAICLILSGTANAAGICSPQKMNELINGDGQPVELDCSPTLSGSDIITKPVHIRDDFSSGQLVVDCNNALLDGANVSQRKVLRVFSRTNSAPTQNVLVKNCRINGNVRIYGLGENGQAPDVKASSTTAGHTQRAQAAAPRNITFENVDIESNGGNAFYLGPGANNITIRDSEIISNSANLAVYLDAESAENVIENNIIGVSGSNGREVMAVDGSSGNTIRGNTFSGLNRGGIYMYRNCGEGGAVRHQTSSDNMIESNYFVYKNYNGSNPAIWVSSRNGISGHCNNDSYAGLQNTSSTDDRDNAANNTIRYNQFLNRDPNNYIRFGTSGIVGSQPNPNDVLLNKPTTYANKKVSSFNYSAEPFTQPFSCKVTANNNGCSKLVQCPSGQVNTATRAACNLESGSVSANDLPDWNVLTVSRQSDPGSFNQSICAVDSINIRSGSAELVGSYNQSISVLCKEFDNNGGDCHIRGEQICY